MSLPDIVADALDGETVATRLSLGGDDELILTPERTLVYRAGGVLRDESVAEYPHEVERLTVSRGRRKASIGFEYPVDGDGDVSVPDSRLDEFLEPVLAGILRKQGATDPEERFRTAFRFSEMTVVVTSERVLKHVGTAVWDGTYDSYHFEDVIDLDYEPGDVATGIVLAVDGRKQRIKAPNERLAELRQELESALFAYHDVTSADELGAERDHDRAEEEPDGVVGFDQGVDPLDPGSPPGQLDVEGTESDRDAPAVPARENEASEEEVEDEQSGTDTPFTEDLEPPPSRDADPDPDVAEELEALRETVERQNRILARQEAAIERLVEQFREG
jgi:hypothetical protein